MITHFADAFEYVNSKYLFNKENYPVIGSLTSEQVKIFSLNHGLLHVLKSANKINDDVPFQKKDIRKLQWIIQPDEKLGTIPLIQKVGTLKMLVNIMSLAHVAGITTEQVSEFKIPSDEEMTILIPKNQMKLKTTPTFPDTISFLVESLACFLENADHKNQLNNEGVHDLLRAVFLATMYWFDDFWVRDFLNQIPNVMKSK